MLGSCSQWEIWRRQSYLLTVWGIIRRVSMNLLPGFWTPRLTLPTLSISAVSEFRMQTKNDWNNSKQILIFDVTKVGFKLDPLEFLSPWSCFADTELEISLSSGQYHLWCRSRLNFSSAFNLKITISSEERKAVWVWNKRHKDSEPTESMESLLSRLNFDNVKSVILN